MAKFIKKIKSILLEKKKKRKIRAKYAEIYKDSDVWLYTKSHGVHSVILGEIKDYLPNKKILDVGCGAGRLAIMCAYFAKTVDAFDFSETAISLAQISAKCSQTKNVNFFVSDIKDFSSKNQKRYDLITLVGVLEHVNNPLSTLKKLNSLLKNNGILVVSCPNFINFRGYTYMTLLTLFDLPMSLVDLRQIDYKDIINWSKKTGFKVQRTVGALYEFAWGEKSVEDMIKRVRLALRDKVLPIRVNCRVYNSWLRSRIESNRMYLRYLEKEGILKKIKHSIKIQFNRPEEVEKDLYRKLKEYANENIEKDPYYCEIEPFCYQGGEGIFFLKKVKEIK